MDKPARRTFSPAWLIGASILLIAVAVTVTIPLEICPGCLGFTFPHTAETRAGRPDTSGMMPCRRCDGRGRVSLVNYWLGHGGRD
jgi:hypothetical protein